jgi:hypothetical protein
MMLGGATSLERAVRDNSWWVWDEFRQEAFFEARGLGSISGSGLPTAGRKTTKP